MTDYPMKLKIYGPTENVLRYFDEIIDTPVLDYAEIGCYEGHTAGQVVSRMAEGGRIHLFDFEDKVITSARKVAEAGGTPVCYPNTRKTYDSYCWTLGELLGTDTKFDVVFIDGAHTWFHDGFAFMLVDHLLRPGGHVLFDDYVWCLAGSSLDPAVFPKILEQYTPEQIERHQVPMIINKLVRSDPRYQERVKDFGFQKIAEWVE